VTIKEEPKSPGCVAMRKCKVYLTTNTNPISVLELVEDADTDTDIDTAQPTGKCTKTASAS